MKIIITEQQYKTLINEYINNEIVYLMKYFSQSEEERIQYIPHDFSYLINDFIENEDIYYDFERPKTSNYVDSDGNDIEEELDDYELVMWLQENNPELYNKFGKWLYDNIKYNNLNGVSPEEYPAWSYYDNNPILVKNQWLIHFINDSDRISKEGFKYGVDEIDKLGLTTYLSDSDKKYGGYNFSYLLRDFNSYGKAGHNSRGGKYKYGKEAVIFRASGVKVFHYGDEEPQVIFYGNSAKNIIPIKTGEKADWAIYNNKTGRIIIESNNLEKLAYWVDNNYSQYSKSLHESKLNESVSDVVFHYTSQKNILSILKNNKINLSPSYGIEADNKINYNKLFSLSLTTARNSVTGYHSTGKNTEYAKGKCRLEMNGRELNYNYKSKHVDYWQYPRTKQFNQNSSFDEMEERIISDKNEIKPANRYINAIEIFIDERNINDYKEILNLATKLNIKCYFYNNPKDFNFSIKKNAVDINQYNQTENNDEKIEYDEETTKLKEIRGTIKTAALLLYKDDIMKNKLFDYASKNNYDIKKLFDYIDVRINNMKNAYLRFPDSYLLRELELSVNSEISFSRIANNELLRYVIKLLGYDMKKRKMKNIAQYVNYKLYIGKKTQQQFNKQLYDKTLKILYSNYNKYISELNNYSFVDINGDYHQPSSDMFKIVPQLKQEMDIIINKISNYFKENMMNNDDMFKYTFYYSYMEIMDVLGLKKLNYELASEYIDYENSTLGEYEIKNVITNTLYNTCDFITKEIENIKEEYRQQYNN